MNGIYGAGFTRTIFNQIEIPDGSTHECMPGQKRRRYTLKYGSYVSPASRQKYHHQRVTKSGVEEVLDVIVNPYLTCEYIPSPPS